MGKIPFCRPLPGRSLYYTRIPVYNNDYSLDLADLLPRNWKASKMVRKVEADSDNGQGCSEKSASPCQF
jgi:hypothetical protein